MKPTKFTSVLVACLLASTITSMGQQISDKRKQEEATKKQKEQVTIIIDSSRYAEKELQKALEESLVAEEKALKSRKLNGYLDNQEFFKQAEALHESQKKLQEMKSAGKNWDAFTLYGNPSMTWRGGENDAVNVYNFAGGRENTSLSISKSLEDVTFSTDFTYEVKEESSRISFFVSGTLKAGELKITLKKPDKTAIQEFTISPLADVNWNQQFNWDEDEAEGYLGKWIISISANKANGNYRVQVNSR
jgi:hypothetical protein